MSPSVQFFFFVPGRIKGQLRSSSLWLAKSLKALNAKSEYSANIVSKATLKLEWASGASEGQKKSSSKGLSYNDQYSWHSLLTFRYSRTSPSTNPKLLLSGSEFFCFSERGFLKYSESASSNFFTASLVLSLSTWNLSTREENNIYCDEGIASFLNRLTKSCLGFHWFIQQFWN